MARPKQQTPKNKEILLSEESFISSKTDLKGIIKYGNKEFIHISGYTESELIGTNHNIIRHPDMPRCVFDLMWKTIPKGNEINAYVKNLAKGGEYYWVFANVTPSFNEAGDIIGYYSVRRKPRRDAVAKAAALYKDLCAIENAESNRKNGIQKATEHLLGLLDSAGSSYEEFVFSL